MVKRRSFRLCPGDEVPTRPVTIQEIMDQPQFTLGVADARAGRPYHRDYDVWNGNGQWGYERGRLWATLAPRDMAIKLGNGKINPDAVLYYAAHHEII